MQLPLSIGPRHLPHIWSPPLLFHTLPRQHQSISQLSEQLATQRLVVRLIQCQLSINNIRRSIRTHLEHNFLHRLTYKRRGHCQHTPSTASLCILHQRATMESRTLMITLWHHRLCFHMQAGVQALHKLNRLNRFLLFKFRRVAISRLVVGDL